MKTCLLWLFCSIGIATATIATTNHFIAHAQQAPKFYRTDVEPKYILWREVHMTTFHGICASLLGNTKGDVWAVYHPYGHIKNKDGKIGSPHTTTHAFGTRDEAISYAERTCPTK